MPRPDQIPTLPVWPFLVGDLVLLAAAIRIETSARHPLATEPLVAIVSCVAVGAALLVVPFLTIYARKQDLALDERQRALESLGATVTASAEQIGIAATGVHEIADLVQKNLRSADQLPHKLQEKIGEFTAQLSNARADETDELEKSLAELRASESDRLAATADKISKAAGELAKLEAAAHQHLAATNAALAQLTAASGQHFTELQAATAAAIQQAQASATTAIDQKLAAAETALSRTRTALFAELDAKLAAITAALTAEKLTEPTRSTPLEKATAPAPANVPQIPTEELEASPPNSVESPASDVGAFPPEVATAPRKRSPKKMSAPFDVEAPVLASAVSLPPNGAVTNSPSLPLTSAATPIATDEFVQFSPEEAPAPLKSVRPSEALLPNLELELPHSESGASTATSDGATRLLVTAYIGIGNRLYIRGHGPGLSWEKGQPLQFVSIGKWRWETNDAIEPVAYKLYKNDALECETLGEQILIPSNQQEVTAVF